jgi:hypothetical protein
MKSKEFPRQTVQPFLLQTPDDYGRTAGAAMSPRISAEIFLTLKASSKR